VVEYWIIPSIGVLIALAVFVLFFHMRPKPAVPAGARSAAPRGALSPSGGRPTDVQSRDAEEHVKQPQDQIR